MGKSKAIKVRIVYSIITGETINALGQDIKIPITKIDMIYMDINKLPVTEDDFDNLEQEIHDVRDGWGVCIISVIELV